MTWHAFAFGRGEVVRVVSPMVVSKLGFKSLMTISELSRHNKRLYHFSDTNFSDTKNIALASTLTGEPRARGLLVYLEHFQGV